MLVVFIFLASRSDNTDYTFWALFKRWFILFHFDRKL